MKSNHHMVYKPLTAEIEVLDNIVLSYIPSESLKTSLKSIHPNKKKPYGYLHQLNAMFTEALKNSYTFLKAPEDEKKNKSKII